MWFDEQTAGLVGGIAGAVIGICGGTWGAVVGMYARKGRFKTFALTFAVVLIGLGVASLCAGIAALAMRQPYHVWYPFTLMGVIVVAVVVPNYVNVKKIYARVETEGVSNPAEFDGAGKKK